MARHLFKLIPSWREAFLGLLSFTIVFVAVVTSLLVHTANRTPALVDEWFYLWERCRGTIEQGTPLDVRNLIPVQLSNLSDISGVAAKRSRAFAPLFGRFAIRESEYGPPDRVTRSCNVELKDDSGPLSTSEISQIFLAFLDRRTQLIAEGSYELREADPIYPAISLGFGPKKVATGGCPVINAIFADLTQAHFWSMSAYQGGDCSVPSMLP